MTRILAGLASLAFLVGIASANTPANDTSLTWSIKRIENIVVLTVTQTDSLAVSGIDTVTVMMPDVIWFSTGGSEDAFTTGTMFNDGASGDSLNVAIDTGVVDDVFQAAQGAAVINGQTYSNPEPTVMGHYWRLRIVNNDFTAHPYSLILALPIH